MSGRGKHIFKGGALLPSAPNRSGDQTTAFSGENPGYATRVAKILEAGPAVRELIAPNMVVSSSKAETTVNAAPQPDPVQQLLLEDLRAFNDDVEAWEQGSGPDRLFDRILETTGVDLREAPSTTEPNNPYDAVGPMEARWLEEDKPRLPWLHGEVTRPETI